MSNGIKLVNIDWDVEDRNELKALPKEIIIEDFELPDYIWEDIEEAIDEYLTKEYGYCHKGYGWKFFSLDENLEKEND